MKTGKVKQDRSLLLQCTEGVLHVLMELRVLSLDLGLSVLHRVLYRHTITSK